MGCIFIVIVSHCIRIENQLVVEQLFKTVWADHADLISIQYTGTGETERVIQM
jgi:hypothetical protein